MSCAEAPTPTWEGRQPAGQVGFRLGKHPPPCLGEAAFDLARSTFHRSAGEAGRRSAQPPTLPPFAVDLRSKVHGQAHAAGQQQGGAAQSALPRCCILGRRGHRCLAA